MSASTTTPKSSPTPPSGKCEYQSGDHIYKWCSYIGIPAVFQHHGIVLDSYWKDDGCGEGKWVLLIADFSNEGLRQFQQLDSDESQKSPSFTGSKGSSTQTIPTSVGSLGTACSVYTYEVSLPTAVKTTKMTKSLKSKPKKQVQTAAKWHKVIYDADWWERQMYRTGTCTSASSDPPRLVRARVQFLIDHPELLPEYDAVAANCECVAVWCKTGTWATLQAVSWLVMTAASQVQSAAAAGVAAAATKVTTVVPAAGLWGWMGYTTTTTVPLIATQPYLLPAIVGYGVISAAAPTIWLLRAKDQAKRTTEKLNESFWKSVIDQPDIFVECIVNGKT